MQRESGGIGKKIDDIKKTNSETARSLEEVIKNLEHGLSNIEGSDEDLAEEVARSISIIKNSCLVNLNKSEKDLNNLKPQMTKVVNNQEKNVGGVNNKSAKNSQDNNFLVLSQTIVEKYETISDNLLDSQGRIINSINKNVVDSSHRLYVNICDENYKRSNEVKKYLRRQHLFSIALNVILIMIFLHYLR